LKSMNPTSKEDWEKLSTELYNELVKKHSTKPGFDKNFVPHLLKLICTNLRDVEIRKNSTRLKEYAEEKVKAEKEAKKSGGGAKKAPKPKTVGTASAKNVIDTKAYGDEALDDDLDFM
ncbi:translation initiation factor eIF3 subunit, partial [Violaceomyces palustris]